MQKIEYKGSNFRFLWAILDSLFIDFFKEIDHEKWEAAKNFICANAWESIEVFGDEIEMQRKSRKAAEKILRPTPEMHHVADLLVNLVAIMNKDNKIDMKISFSPKSFKVGVKCKTDWMRQLKTKEVKVEKKGVTIYYKKK